MKHLNPASGFQLVYRTPTGFDDLVLVSDGEAVTGVFFEGSKDADRVVAARPADAPARTAPLFRDLSAWLDASFSGRDPGPPPPWRTPGLSPFALRVQRAMLGIPWGETRAYGDIAAEIARERGVPRVSAQAVGQAVGSNPLCLLVPCHRVVGAGGRLVGYGGGLANKAALLRLESRDRTPRTPDAEPRARRLRGTAGLC